MKTEFRLLTVVRVMLPAALFLSGWGCGSDPTEPAPRPPTILEVTVRSAADSSLLQNSNVVLYEAETREAVLRDMTDANGTVYFRCEQGDYYVSVSAQGFDAVPAEHISPVPFFVTAEDTTVKQVLLDPLELSGSMGYVPGVVDPALNNFLILAEPGSSSEVYSTVSGPDGFFVLYNLPYGVYSLSALKSGYKMDQPVDVDLSSPAEPDVVRIEVSEYVGSLLTGMVSFLASENSTVDITLLELVTRSVVPGLSVMSDVTGLEYRIEGIPDGDFLAWASLKNDGYVIDPDWMFKNPGGLEVSFATSDTVHLNFSVTDAITLVSPTNPAASTSAVMADSTVPTFTWLAYPSAKEYIIEVRDLSGHVLWGGFEADGTVSHAFIGAGVLNVEYNFDGQAGIPALEPGEVYQWRLWADQGTQQDSFVEQLISSSEDLRGIFQVPANP